MVFFPEQKEETAPQTEPFEHDPDHGLTAIYPITQRPSTNEGKEHPVIIVPGEDTNCHIQKVSTTRTAELPLPSPIYPFRSPEQRSEVDVISIS